jgi:agmatine deiminase
MPAEWEPHEATWIAWPHRRDDWPGKFAAIGWVYAEIVRHLHLSERVRILVNDPRTQQRVRRLLQRVRVDMGQIDFYQVPTDRGWTRDSGPIFISGAENELAITDWKFNAWAKYRDWQHDDALPRFIARVLKVRAWEVGNGSDRVVLEGGSIDVNGQGLLITSEECLLDEVQARNPGLGREALERILADYLGVRKTLWLGKGIEGDDTHGHVDDLARFVGPTTVVAAVEEDPTDSNYEPLRENFNRLCAARDPAGRPLEVVPLPMPAPVWFSGRRLPASYANFYIANNCVLVPTFNDPQDRRALGILADLFPGRTVVGIHSTDLVWGLGTIHCLTQQQPKARMRDQG